MRLTVCVLAALMFPASMAFATVAVTVTEAGTGNSTVAVAPGGTFSVDVLVSESNEGTGVSGVQLSLDSTGPVNGKIAVAGPADNGGTSAVINGAEWDTDVSASGTGLALPLGLLSVQPVGAGYSANGGKLSGSVTPSSRLMTVQMSVAADAPDGAYVVSASGLAFPDFAGSTDDILVTPGAGLTVNVGQGVCTASVVNRQLFYGNSAWGTASVPNTPGVAGNKVAKLPGTGPATFENVSSYSRGINGIYIDVQGLCGTPTAADFAFRCGNTTSIANWSVVPPEPTISVLAGQGSNGSDRIRLDWADNAIPTKNWLQVTVKATPATGLPADDVFYFGSLIGETGDGSPATRFTVTSTDYNAVYNNRNTTPVMNREITDLYDMDRSKNVNSTDYNAYGYNVRSSSPADGLIVINP